MQAEAVQLLPIKHALQSFLSSALEDQALIAFQLASGHTRTTLIVG